VFHRFPEGPTGNYIIPYIFHKFVIIHLVNQTEALLGPGLYFISYNIDLALLMKNYYGIATSLRAILGLIQKFQIIESSVHKIT
jgi:hypothetical protein